MYTNKNKDLVEDNAPYTGLDGTKYPSNFPKSEITELSLVTTTAQPTTGDVITGSHIDSTNTQVWDTRVKTVKELAQEAKVPIDQMRAKRDMLLAQSDFAVLSDAPLTTLQVTAYKKYRTQLRDLPKVFPTGVNVIYPTKPK